VVEIDATEIEKVTLNKSLYKSDRPDWNTPESVMEIVYQFFPDGIVDLDPCSNPGSVVKSRKSFDGIDGNCGLAAEWTGSVYVNPPYGRAINLWIEKCASHRNDAEILALLPARTDTKWFNCAADSCAAICFIRGRIRFLGANASAPFPSCFVYWGENKTRFCGLMNPHGQVFEKVKYYDPRKI